MVQAAQPKANGQPTIWGLTPVELHDRFWAARGVQVVRPHVASEIVEDAELFLLMAPRLLTIFRLRPLVDELSWVKPDVLWVRIRHNHERGYRERAITDVDGRFRRFERNYGGSDARLARVGLTPKREVALLWQAAPNAHDGWQQLRRRIDSRHRSVISIAGRTYDRGRDDEVMQFVRQLVQTWTRPDATVHRVRKVRGSVWADTEATLDRETDFVGPSWIGAGRQLTKQESVIGPAILWDDPLARPATEHVQWQQLEPTQVFDRPIRPREKSDLYRRVKRMFDLTAATVTILLLSPILPLIMLAIYMEDGRPFFFIHRRESTGGRTFGCIKFRSMYKNADQIKEQLVDQNQVDGPQFYIEHDPRVTRVGRVLRKFHLDELPQLINVLIGEMSIVGPRPSPYEENQFCPSWREARLSTPPGVTGLWQVMRTRRHGLDFQEWIKYDIEYVQNASFRLDLWIVGKTVFRVVLRR